VKRIPSLRVTGTHAGSPVPDEDESIRERIQAAEARVLLVAYGMPAQERWIARNLPLLPSVRTAIGVGGVFDQLAGRVRVPPRIVHAIGFEWLWRLSFEPHRWRRLGESHRFLLPLYPNAARALRVPPETDVALVSTSAFIKEIGLADRTVAVAYCHSPTRYLYDWSERYLEEEVPQPLVPLVRDLLGRLRDGDQRAARRFDRWMANSTAVRGRIETYYGVTASAIEIVHPPVDVGSFAANEER